MKSQTKRQLLKYLLSLSFFFFIDKAENVTEEDTRTILTALLRQSFPGSKLGVSAS